MMQVCDNGPFTCSAHAATRMAQRGISWAALDLVLLHGTQSKAKRDCEEYLLPNRAAQQLEAAGYNGQLIKAATKIRAIVDPYGTVVTCYHERNRQSGSLHRKTRNRRARRGLDPQLVRNNKLKRRHF